MSRPATPVIYENTEKFSIGKAKVVVQSDEDQVLVIGAGVTLAEALAAAETLAAEGIKIRVMDPFTIKPLDVQAVREHAQACGGRVITVDDHYPEVNRPGFRVRLDSNTDIGWSGRCCAGRCCHVQEHRR